ncbi:LZIC-like protein [Sarcoptes scabiei]|nr:LZIC-like protein [Sarcoptes scabiei]
MADLATNNGHTNYGIFSNSQTNNDLNRPPNHLIKDAKFKKLNSIEPRNSHSLVHDFQQLYISNLKHQLDNNQSVNVKTFDSNKILEEISSYRKDALESKKRMFQMEKSISFWSDCTTYWRNKWRTIHEEKTKLNDEVLQLQSRINKLEHQLRISDEKRLRLGNEVCLLNEELSRYMCKFNHENKMNVRSKVKKYQRPAQQLNHFNSDRRIDYRKKHRRKKDSKESIRQEDSSSSELDSRDQSSHLPRTSSSMQKEETIRDQSLGRIRNEVQSLSLNKDQNKILYRNHERLFDKKIINKKRFSQVVMLDEDEILQMNKEISINTINPTSSSLNETLKSTGQKDIQNDHLHFNDSIKYLPQNKHQLYMDYVPEDVEEEEDSFDDRIKPGQFLNDFDFGTTGIIESSANINKTNTTDSECPNVSSTNHNVNDQSDLRSFSTDDAGIISHEEITKNKQNHLTSPEKRPNETKENSIEQRTESDDEV